jgi:hypothetical protein
MIDQKVPALARSNRFCAASAIEHQSITRSHEHASFIATAPPFNRTSNNAGESPVFDISRSDDARLERLSSVSLMGKLVAPPPRAAKNFFLLG